MRFKKTIKILIVAIGILTLLGIIATASMNLLIIGTTKNSIITVDEAKGGDFNCILVLGAKVMDDGTLSHMLEDRVLQGIELFENSASNKILMSGDHGRKGYDEVGNMKRYAVNKGINPDKIFMDHAGFSTYESIYRARDIFEAKKVLIVTQKYHLYRALYIADILGLEAYGVEADLRDYQNDFYNNSREYLARVKAFLMCIYKPRPTFLGDAIPISGDGNMTDDNSYYEW